MFYPIASALTLETLLPVLVFVAETFVLTLATLRTISIARGKKLPAATLGFFEVCIWLFAVGQVMQNLHDIRCATAFAAGFALGNFLGVLIEQKLAIGSLTVQVTTKRDACDLVDDLRLAGYGVTRMKGEGLTGPVDVVITVVQRKNLRAIAAIIHAFDENAFYSVHDLQSAAEGVFPRQPERGLIPMPVARMLRFAALRNDRKDAPMVAQR